MFERFTDQARHAVTGAQAEARALQHGYLGTEHLLLGLLRDPDDLPAQVLTRYDIGLETARRLVVEIIGERNDTPAGNIPFTSRAKTILEIALREAQNLRHDHIGSGHLLLALIHEGQGVAPQVLTRLGADLADIDHDVLQQLPADRGATVQEHAPPSAAVAARLDGIEETLTDIAARLAALERHLTGQ